MKKIKSLKLNTMLLIAIGLLLILNTIMNLHDYTLGLKDNASLPSLIRINKISGKACLIENYAEFVYDNEKAKCFESNK